MAIGVEGTMGALSRVVDWVLADSGSLDPDDVSNAIDRAAATQAPMRASQVHQQASDSLTGMGPLDVLLEDSTVSDILVNAHDEIWIERDGHLERSEIEFPTAEAVIAAVERALLPLGLRLDRASPSVDARLPDGSRLHAMVPPAAVDGPVVAIRRFTAAVLEIEDLIAV